MARETIRGYLFKEILPREAARDIDDDAALIDSGLIDSIGRMRLVSFLEKTFKVKITAEDVREGKLNTVSSIAKLVGEAKR